MKRAVIVHLLAAFSLAVVAPGCGGEGNSAVTAAIKAPSPEQSAGSSTVQPVTLAATLNENVDAENPAAHRGEELHPEVVVKTSLGDITIKLDADKAPTTVDNFLRNYVDRGFYAKTIFHYVEDGYMAAAGGYSVDGQAKPTRAAVRNEAHNGLKNVRGTIAMSRQAEYVHSATSQFWINLADNPFLDHQSGDSEDPQAYGYCVFGEIVEGMDIVDRIAKTPVHDTEQFTMTPIEPVTILSIQRVK